MIYEAFLLDTESVLIYIVVGKIETINDLRTEDNTGIFVRMVSGDEFKISKEHLHPLLDMIKKMNSKDKTL